MSEVEWLRIFSNNLYEMMYDKHLTQQDLSDMTGYSQATISKWLNGTQAPTVFAVINLSYALDEDYDDLIDFGDRVKR